MRLSDFFKSALSDSDAKSTMPQNLDHQIAEHPKEASAKEVKPGFVEEEFYIHGVKYFLDQIQLLASSNPDWRKSSKTLTAEGKVMKKIFRYNYVNKPVKIIAEPENQSDKNAMYVQIAGEKVGYISRDENIHVREILSSKQIKYITARISGGDYKIVFGNGTVEKLFYNVSVRVKIGYVK